MLVRAAALPRPRDNKHTKEIGHVMGDIMRRVLSPTGGVSPHTTSAYGVPRKKGTSPHKGVDFNYYVGPNGQSGINLQHPALRSPVDGVVENAGEGTVGRIAIRDANGILHEILHTHTRHVAIGDPVAAGQLIGTMGNTGVERANIEHGDHHVHQQMWDPAGNRMNPTEFWDQQGPADPNPAPPAYLREYQQYLRGPGANVGNGFGNAPGTANMPAPGSFDAPSDRSPPLYARQTEPRPGRGISGKSGSSFFDAGTPVVPFAPPNDVLSAGRRNPFDNRFGNWASLPAAPPSEGRPSDRQDFPGDRFGNWTSSPDGSITPRNPNLPMPPPEPGRPLGIVSGKPMPLWTTPVPLGGGC
jgi:Peptidase family M23